LFTFAERVISTERLTTQVVEQAIIVPDIRIGLTVFPRTPPPFPPSTLPVCLTTPFITAIPYLTLFPLRRVIIFQTAPTDIFCTSYRCIYAFYDMFFFMFAFPNAHLLVHTHTRTRTCKYTTILGDYSLCVCACVCVCVCVCVNVYSGASGGASEDGNTRDNTRTACSAKCAAARPDHYRGIATVVFLLRI